MITAHSKIKNHHINDFSQLAVHWINSSVSQILSFTSVGNFFIWEALTFDCQPNQIDDRVMIINRNDRSQQ